MTNIGEILNISNSMPLGIGIGVVGLIMTIVNYPIYKGILEGRKKKYADRIISLSDKIMNN